MKEMLKKIYKDSFIDNVTSYDFTKYYYFIDKKQYIFGILKNSLNNNELKLILTHYELLTEDIKPTKYEYIVDFLLGNGETLPKYKELKYYFIKFLNTYDEEVYSEVDKLFKELFNDYLCFVKKHNIYIIIVTSENDFQFKDILKSIEGDFLTPIIGFESDYHLVDEQLPLIFKYDFNAFKSYQKNNNLFLNKIDLIQNKIFKTIDDDIRLELKRYVLKSFINDNEMINVIKTYFKTNLNTTLAAKMCYMHRNTFINKIDKFIEVTKFNIRNYDEAFIVYLSIII